MRRLLHAYQNPAYQPLMGVPSRNQIVQRQPTPQIEVADAEVGISRGLKCSSERDKELMRDVVEYTQHEVPNKSLEL